MKEAMKDEHNKAGSDEEQKTERKSKQYNLCNHYRIGSRCGTLSDLVDSSNLTHV
jgi:hypothetical protein